MKPKVSKLSRNRREKKKQTEKKENKMIIQTKAIISEKEGWGTVKFQSLKAFKKYESEEKTDRKKGN